MKIKIVTVGKLKEKYLKDGIAEYSKRISRFAKLEMIELADEKTPDKASEIENQKILECNGLKWYGINWNAMEWNGKEWSGI